LIRQTWGSNYIDFLYDENGSAYSFIYNGTQYYYVRNLQGDVVRILNTSGTTVVAYSYDAWGKCTVTSGASNAIANANPIRYRGYYYDTETGFYYLQSRYYDPAVKRFISADGYVNANGDLIGFNMYAYCGNNPINMVDYDGESVLALKLLTDVFVIVTTIVGIYLIGEVTRVAYQEFVYSDKADSITYANDAIKNKIESSSENKSHNHTVYLLKDDNGNVQYVGRTINPKKRADAYSLNPNRSSLKMEVVASGLTYNEARAVEQSCIFKYGTIDTSNKMKNQINSIARNKWIGYQPVAETVVKYTTIAVSNEVLYWLEYIQS